MVKNQESRSYGTHKEFEEKPVIRTWRCHKEHGYDLLSPAWVYSLDEENDFGIRPDFALDLERGYTQVTRCSWSIIDKQQFFQRAGSSLY